MTSTTNVTGFQRSVEIPSKENRVHAFLSIPAGASALVILLDNHTPHECTSDLAARLEKESFGTLRTSLPFGPIQGVEPNNPNVQDMQHAISDFENVLDWIAGTDVTCALRVGVVACEELAAVALVGAAKHPEVIKAVVSIGGRPDMANEHLPRVQAPTLLVVGDLDRDLPAINREALSMLTCEKSLEAVPGSSTQCETPATREEIIARVADWLTQHVAHVYPAGSD